MNTSPLDKENGETSRPGTVACVDIEDYRNYERAHADLAPGFNVVFGRNAQGKTNFLEAMYLLATTRLLRGKRDSEGIRDGSDSAKVSATLVGSGTEIAFAMERGFKKRALLNGVALPRASDLIGRLRVVCVSAADMEIVRGDPSQRRLFLDLELSAVSPAYLRHLTLYKRAMEQRNVLLRDSRDRRHAAETFEVWEDQIAQHGASIRRFRNDFVAELGPFAESVHSEMGAGERLTLGYRTQDECLSYEQLLEGLAGGRLLDIQKGATSLGPHRDDLEIGVQTREARLYGSQGQQRTAVISVKLAVLSLMRDREGMAPLLLLDDILSDLDEARRRMLVDIVFSRADQAVLTCTEASAAGKEILSRAKLFEVSSGTIRES
jgi:DNA replication and repair protein RecF